MNQVIKPEVSYLKKSWNSIFIKKKIQLYKTIQNQK
jgi:hypothetical protein